ncbi:reverse transcriptase domain-containing protein [Tanacetum coccineum]
MDDTYMRVSHKGNPSERQKESKGDTSQGIQVCRDQWNFIQEIFLGTMAPVCQTLQANYVLREIHEGSCSMHSGPRSVVAKAIRTGYYWPTMHTDAQKLIRECNDC